MSSTGGLASRFADDCRSIYIVALSTYPCCQSVKRLADDFDPAGILGSGRHSGFPNWTVDMLHRGTMRERSGIREPPIQKNDDATSGPQSVNASKATRLQLVEAICLLFVCLLAVGVLTASILALNKRIRGEGTSDFVQYWATGHLLVHGRNPYEAQSILQLERSVAEGATTPQISFSPPPIFALAAPIGLFDFRTGAVLWMIFLAACLAMAVHLLWIVYGRRLGGLHLLCLCYAPALACFMAGQIGTFLLLAIALYFYLQDRWPFLAGMALAACALKPHLFVPFGIVLIASEILAKRNRVFLGMGAGLLALASWPMLLNHQIWRQYVRMISSARPVDLPVPSLSRTFRLAVYPHSTWVQFLPTFAACAWALLYFWYLRKHWRIPEHGPILLLVSVACAPYAWFTDEAILLPIVLIGLYRAVDSGRTLLPFALIAGFMLGELLRGVWITSPYLMWTPPAWLAWYLYSSRRKFNRVCPRNNVLQSSV
jgi:hypothetical protein